MKCNNYTMEKKVLLKDLVDSGTSLRKQITSKVRVSDQGAYPIGEIWDANTTINTIVDGASIAFDTLKEVEQKLEQHDAQIAAEVARATAAEEAEKNRAIAAENAERNRAIQAEQAEVARATAAEQAIYDHIGDLGTKREEVRVRPWGDRIFGKGNDHKEWGVASVPEELGMEFIVDEQGNTTFEIEWFQMLLESQVDGAITPSKDYNYVWNEETWNNSYQNGGLKLYYEAYPDEDRWNEQEQRPARSTDKVDGQWPDYCVQCWKGAINAPGAKFPWIVPYFTEDVNSKIIFAYNKKTNVPHTVKSYIDEMVQWAMKYATGGGSLGPDSVTTLEIQDGTIKVEDLSDDLKDKIQPSVDEENENVFIG